MPRIILETLHSVKTKHNFVFVLLATAIVNSRTASMVTLSSRASMLL